MLCERRAYLNDRTGCGAATGIHHAEGTRSLTEAKTIIVTSQRNMLRRNDGAQLGSGLGHVWTAPCGQALFGVVMIAVGCRPYVPLTNEATHPRCNNEGCPDRPGRASYMEGESWGIIAKLSSELIRRNRVMQWQLPKVAVAVRCAISGSSPPLRRQRASSLPSLQRNTVI